MNDDLCFANLGPVVQTALAETLELMTEEQKRKFTERRLDRAVEFIELKIIDMEKRISIAKESIADIRKDKEMIR
jgi:hypothetical protein